MKTLFGIIFGCIALWGLGGIFSEKIRSLAWKKPPLSRMTSGLFFFLFAQASLLAFGVMERDMIYTTIVPAILCAASVGDDYFGWRGWWRRRRKHEVMGLPGSKKYGNKKDEA